MKSLIALLALAFIVGCGNNSNTRSNDPGDQRPQAPTTGFTLHAWCFAYPDQGGQVQDRFMFANGGTLNYRRYAWVNLQRGALLGEANGTWALNGSALTLWIGTQRLDFQIDYRARDPQTGAERVYVTGPGGTSPYDPCN